MRDIATPLLSAQVKHFQTPPYQRLSARVLEQEHRLFPQAVATFSAQLLQEKPK
jgi:folate-dependent phosphoribosylglycinamide formyltransferase PurN